MPYYEYKCENGHRFDRKYFMGDVPKHTSCTECGQLAERRFSKVNVTFGWRLAEESHIRGHRDKWERDV